MQIRTIREQHQGRCVHFNGMMNNECKAGMVYDEVINTKELGRTGCALRLPCLKRLTDDARAKGVTIATCAQLRFPTDEETDAYEKILDDSMAKFTPVYPLIGKIKKEHKGKDWRGTVECPTCKGKLHMTHAACNGHVHGTCETEGCVRWME